MGKIQLKKANKEEQDLPKLSFSDRCLYILAYVLIFVFAALLCILFMSVHDRVAFSEHVIASSVSEGYLIAVLLLIAAAAVPFLALMSRQEKRQPFFGRRNAERVKVPGGGKRSSQGDTKRKHAKRKIQIIIITETVILVLLVLSALLCLFERSSITDSGEVHTYDVLNRETSVYHKEDIVGCYIRAEQHIGQRYTASYWECELTLVMKDDRKIYFTIDDFRGTLAENLENMQKIKEFAKEQNAVIGFSGREELEWIAEYNGFTDEEKELFYNLFDN